MPDQREDPIPGGFIPFADKWLGFLLVEGSYAFVDSDGLSADIEDVPLSQGLKDRIRAWQAAILARIAIPGFEPLTDFRDYLRDGFTIACAIKTELPDWTVGYDDPFTPAPLRGPLGFAELKNDGTLERPVEPNPQPAPAPSATASTPDVYVEDIRNFLTTRFVTIMGDGSASGIWDKQGFPIDVDDLPISTSLKRRIDDWQDWYETCEDLDQNDQPAPWDAFSVQGLEIARAVKAELPAWTVEYVDEALLIKDDRSRDKRVVFRFEISAGGSAKPMPRSPQTDNC